VRSSSSSRLFEIILSSIEELILPSGEKVYPPPSYSRPVRISSCLSNILSSCEMFIFSSKEKFILLSQREVHPSSTSSHSMRSQV